MNTKQLLECCQCGGLSALSARVACKLCRLERERNYQELLLEQALARVTEIQDTLRGIAQEQTDYRVAVITAQLQAEHRNDTGGN